MRPTKTKAPKILGKPGRNQEYKVDILNFTGDIAEFRPRFPRAQAVT